MRSEYLKVFIKFPSSDYHYEDFFKNHFVFLCTKLALVKKTQAIPPVPTGLFDLRLR